MTEASHQAVLGSGFMELTPETIERLPESPGWFRLRSSGQRVMLVGHAGVDGLRAAVRQAVSGQPIAGFATVEYESCDDEAAARAAAAADIDAIKPLYNDGFGRYRNSDTHLPKKGHRVRLAMQNP